MNLMITQQFIEKIYVTIRKRLPNHEDSNLVEERRKEREEIVQREPLESSQNPNKEP